MTLTTFELAKVQEALGKIRGQGTELIDAARRFLQATDLLSQVPADGFETLLAQYHQLIKRTIAPAGDPDQVDQEDRYLCNMFRSEKIRYVEIGTAYPSFANSTYPFYRRGGRGVLIEPVPKFWYDILKTRPRDTLWPAAASDYLGQIRMRVCDGCSSVDPSWPIGEAAEIVVECRPLHGILIQAAPAEWAYEDHGADIDLCVMDVEGHERSVLRGVSWEHFKPKVWMIEYTQHVPDLTSPIDRSPEWSGILLEHGYTEWHTRTRLNAFFIRNDVRDRWSRAQETNA